MKIDKDTYKLSTNNYIPMECVKKQIIIGHTYNSEMRHVIKWSTRLNGEYTKTAAYTIDFNGNVFEHFDPIFSSTFFENPEQDTKSIVILLENEGWLIKDEENSRFINWIGHIYKRQDEVIEKNWRNQVYWAPYTEAQIESLVELTNNLCDEFNLPKIAIPHNAKIDIIDSFDGVLYRSNIDRNYRDLSPAFNCIEFKNKLEINEK